MELPEWVAKHKVKGTEVRLFKGKYYLYEISSKWNKEKKRAQKNYESIFRDNNQRRTYSP